MSGIIKHAEVKLHPPGEYTGRGCSEKLSLNGAVLEVFMVE